jgi:hypothetical protein
MCNSWLKDFIWMYHKDLLIMSSLEEFLENFVPSVLRKAQIQFPFIVVGTRAVNAYLHEAHAKAIPTQDWDIAYRGGLNGQNSLADYVTEQVEASGYSVEIEKKLPKSRDNDTFALKARPWIRLSVNIGDAHITFLDIYSIPYTNKSELGPHTIKDGLAYSDLGFLIRELNRTQQDASKLIQEASRFSGEQVGGKMNSAIDMLNDSRIDLSILDQDTHELIESLGQLSDDNVRELLQEHKQRLNQAKKTLMRVVEEREALFGVIMNGLLSKELTHQVCDLCRSLEEQFGTYKMLQDRCAAIQKMC